MHHKLLMTVFIMRNWGSWTSIKNHRKKLFTYRKLNWIFWTQFFVNWLFKFLKTFQNKTKTCLVLLKQIKSGWSKVLLKSRILDFVLTFWHIYFYYCFYSRSLPIPFYSNFKFKRFRIKIVIFKLQNNLNDIVLLFFFFIQLQLIFICFYLTIWSICYNSVLKP